MKSFLVALLLTLLAGPAAAQEQVEVVNTNRGPVYVAATAASLGSIGVGVYQAYKSPDPERAFGCLALRLGAANGAALLTKHFVHETRPDGSSNDSFFSQHTVQPASAISWGNRGWSFNIGFTIGVGAGQVIDKRHHPWDVVVGGLVGEATHLIPGCR